ncbi:hypothetical protein HMPREF1487_08277 [Pseudomonas sp. HPB0071]|uniref:carbohydrate porin n=1 Tax=Pseudomonas sp. HPB0071 TaxID=1203578 RepID=UPI0002CBECAB|nr:carbohydrate porin [Pseudomonas sp. HPB0071]ENA30023.1 hypothetical protein HMPREF1487_08277 [Pseudomonas sp. HPB0071]
MYKHKGKRVRHLAVLSLAALGGLSATAHAADAFDPEAGGMTGDWGGLRTELLDKGYDIKLEYVGEGATNMRGGYDKDHTARWSSQYMFGLAVDMNKTLGWENSVFKVAITSRDGRNLTNDNIGDPRSGTYSSVQEVWGRGQTWRLTQLWLSKGFFDGRLDIKAGRFGEGEDFNSFDCDFQNLAFCGSQVGNWVGDQWYNWPVSQWAMRVKYNLTPELFAQVGVYEQNPSLLETGNGFKMNTSGAKGVILPVELVWLSTLNSLPGEYRFGYYYSTADADDVDGVSSRHSSKHGYWVVAKQQLTKHNGDASRGLSVFANFTVHDKATNKVDNYIQAGVVYKGPFDARPKDDIGFGVARIHTNSDARDAQRAANLATGIDDYDNPGYVPLQYSEYDAELYYGVHVTNWLTLRPNIQYMRNPGGVKEVDNAVVGGLKVQAVF